MHSLNEGSAEGVGNWEMSSSSHCLILNSLTAMGCRDRPSFNELRARVVPPQIFVRCQCLMARKIAELFGLNRGIRPFYAACCFDVLSRGSVLCLLNASFKQWFHNATTQFFTPKSMTMASAGAIRGKYLPNGGV